MVWYWVKSFRSREEALDKPLLCYRRVAGTEAHLYIMSVFVGFLYTVVSKLPPRFLLIGQSRKGSSPLSFLLSTVNWIVSLMLLTCTRKLRAGTPAEPFILISPVVTWPSCPSDLGAMRHGWWPYFQEQNDTFRPSFFANLGAIPPPKSNQKHAACDTRSPPTDTIAACLLADFMSSRGYQPCLSGLLRERFTALFHMKCHKRHWFCASIDTECFYFIDKLYFFMQSNPPQPTQ